MNHTSQKRIATTISRIFDPFVTMGAVSILAVFKSGLSGWPLYLFLFGVTIASIVFLAVLLHWAIKRGHVSNWDLSNRRERFIPIAVAIGVLIVDLIIARFFINDFLVDLFVLYILWIIGFFFITLFWKISGHTAGAALAVGLLIWWYGSNWWPILLFIPLVGWARVVRRDHTVYQVIMGVVYTGCILMLYRQ